MCKVFSTFIRFVLAILNLVVGLAFLGLGVVGVLLLTNKEFLLKYVKNAIEHFLDGITKEQGTAFAEFIVKHEVHAPVIFITVGFTIALVCFLGFIASCFSCGKFLKIYAIVLAFALVAQIVAIGIIVGMPKLYKAIVYRGFEKLLTLYDPTTEEGKRYVSLWDTIMDASKAPCCGMDGAGDFVNSPMKDKCPKYCCRSSQSCTIQYAMNLKPPVPGCRDRIGDYAAKYMKRVFVIFLIFIAAQFLLLVLTCAALTCKTATPI